MGIHCCLDGRQQLLQETISFTMNYHWLQEKPKRTGDQRGERGRREERERVREEMERAREMERGEAEGKERERGGSERGGREEREWER